MSGYFQYTGKWAGVRVLSLIFSCTIYIGSYVQVTFPETENSGVLGAGATQMSHSLEPAIESQVFEWSLRVDNHHPQAPPHLQGLILRKTSEFQGVPVNPTFPPHHHTSIKESNRLGTLYVLDRANLPPAVHIFMDGSRWGPRTLSSLEMPSLIPPKLSLVPHHPALDLQCGFHYNPYPALC